MLGVEDGADFAGLGVGLADRAGQADGAGAAVRMADLALPALIAGAVAGTASQIVKDESGQLRRPDARRVTGTPCGGIQAVE